MDKVFLDEEELLDLEKVNELCKDNLCDADSLDFDYMHIQEIVNDFKLSAALNKLTEKQKFVLYMIVTVKAIIFTKTQNRWGLCRHYIL